MILNSIYRNGKAIVAGVVLLLTVTLGYSQTGIGTTTPDPDAQLEISATNKGVLITRVELSGTNLSAPLNSHVAGMIVYNTATNGSGSTAVTPGFYYNDGTKWVRTLGSGEVIAVNSGLSSGIGAPTATNPASPNAGDIYVDESTGDLYTFDGTEWTKQPEANVDTGTGVPTATDPADPTGGDIYIDESTGDIYTYNSTTNMWESQSDIISTDADNLIVEGTDGLAFLSKASVEAMTTGGLSSGTGAPTATSPASPDAGDIYVDESTGDLYTFDGTTWTKQPEANVDTGTGVPTATDPADPTGGDIYIDESTGDVYTYNSTTNMWESQSEVVSPDTGNIITEDANGLAFLNETIVQNASGVSTGIGAPTATNPASPNAGDIYVDESTGDVYTYNSTTNMWDQQGITGPAGPAGADGQDGTSVTILGTFADTSMLPTIGNTNGDGYLINGDLHVWDGTMFVNVGNIQGPAGDPATDDQTLSLSGTTLAISGGNSVNLGPTIAAAEVDGDTTNELNTAFAVNGTNLDITDAGGTLSVPLANIAAGTDTDDQNLSLTGTTLNIDDGTGVDLASLVAAAEVDGDTTNELNTGFAVNGTNLDITDAGGTLSVPLANIADNLGDHTATQTLNLNGNYLSGDGDAEGVFVDADGNVGIGTASLESSAALEVSSTTQGFLPPRMTTTQINAITSPATGLMVYNTTLFCLQVNDGTPASPSWNCISGTVPSTVGTITSLDCAGATDFGTLESNTAASGVSSVISYTGGDGGTHTGQTVASTGVTGLTATVAAGSFATGAGTLTYTITGTPSAAGTASFAISIGGQTCTLTRDVSLPALPAPCTTATISATPCSSVSGATINDDAGTTLGTEYDWTGATTSGMANTSTTQALVDISGQCWMRYDMRTVPSSGSSWYSTGGPITNEGRLYNWAGAMNGSTTERAQGVCPTGWHVPSDCEWMYLESNLGMSTADLDNTGWRNSGTVGSDLSSVTGSGNNNSGFTALLGGNRSTAGAFYNRGSFGHWWSSSELSASAVWARTLSSSQTGVSRAGGGKATGFSLRCLKD